MFASTAVPSDLSPTLAETELCLRHGHALPPIRRWRKALVAAISGLALAFGLAAPASAGPRDRDVAEAVAAIVILGLIANQIDKRQDRKARPARNRAPRVPATCAIRIDGAGDSVTVYPESCLRAEGFHHRLPERCANDARIYGRPDRIYGVPCLKSAGFRVGPR